MGLTFKENCPDIRNTKVFDIIGELEDYGCNIDVYDPWVDSKEFKATYDRELISDPFTQDKKYEAIIVCVSHHQFLDISTEDYSSISKGTPIVLDIKGIVKEPTWRL
jgi:UDP-N-acetyl-D-galactosamine dehydrogenase